MADIVDRLSRCTPYGLEDFAVLIDAEHEIKRLRKIITDYYVAENRCADIWDQCYDEEDVHTKIHNAWVVAHDALEAEATVLIGEKVT